MRIKLNEKYIDVNEGITLSQVHENYLPKADVIILNGAAMSQDMTLSEEDEVVLITRGEIPASDELESLLVSRHTPGVHSKLKEATIGIAGLGGLGSNIAIALTRVGVGKLILADFDIVEPSNLNRQQYFIDQLGLSKAEALVENLERINPYVEYVHHVVKLTPNNIPEIFEGVDIMVEAFDAPDQKSMLIQTCGKAFPECPVVMGSGMAGYASSQSIKVNKISKNVYVVGDMENAAKPGWGLMAPRVGICAHMQANTVVQLLLGIDPS